jgi:predicted lysophospholipase L1 biosynthesis ABC-type transport system permease subunit
MNNRSDTPLYVRGGLPLVLLIACANVASLLLSRALGRRKEFAIRTALGGSRVKLVRQLLTESVLIGLVAGVFGIGLGVAGTQLLRAFGQETLPGASEVSIDVRVLLFTLTISMFAGILFGLAPSLQLSKPDLNSALREEGRGTAGNRKRNRGRAVLVSTMYSALNQYHVVMEAAPEFLQNSQFLSQVYVRTPGGYQVPLSALATFGPTTAPLSVNHQGLGPAVT